MADNILAKFHYGDNNCISQNYRAKAYIDDTLTNYQNSHELENLMKAIKDYGHYAQLMLDAVHDEWTLGLDHVAMDGVNVYSDIDKSTVVEATKKYEIIRNTGDSKVESVGFSLSLDSYTAINLYLNMSSTYSSSVDGSIRAYFTNGGELLVQNNGNNQYVINVDDIPAHELAKTNYITITVGENSFEIQVSALSYVYSVLTDNSNNIYECETAIALYNYYKANMNYRKIAGYID